MLKAFKEFAFRGNLIDVAVAFVLGVAFAAVVTSLVDDVISWSARSRVSRTSPASPSRSGTA